MESVEYGHIAIPETAIPAASSTAFQHLLDTYASETNKVVAVWREFSPDDLAYRPHPRAASIGEVLKHQLLSERRFLGK